MGGLKLMPAGEADVARSVAIENVAYGPNVTSLILFPGPFEGESDADRQGHMLEMLRADPDSCLWIKAVDEDLIAQGQHGMVSFAMGYLWTSTVNPTPERIWGPGSNPEACELLFGTLTRKWFERMGDKPHFYVKLLHTDPAHQKRGAGTMLLQHFGALADQHGLESYLEATADGLPLYKKVGFEVVEILETDFSKWGGPAKDETYLMLRKPKMTAN